MEPEGQQNGDVLTKLKELFDEVDEDKSGAIDYPEMIKLLEKINIQNPSFLTILFWYSLNKEEDESMSYDDFKAIMNSCKSLDELPTLISKLVFVKIDADHSGTIELDEFFQLFAKFDHICPIEKIKKCFQHYDKDKSGSLEYNEFKRFLRRITSK